MPRIVALHPGEATEAMALSIEAGWNQIPDDWNHFFRNGQVMGCRDTAGRLVATAAVLPYEGPFGFVAMVLVTAAHRRQGLATGLIGHCVSILKALGKIAVLDATQQGQPVYRRQGFEPKFRFARWQSPCGGGAPAARGASSAQARAITALDTAAFGARRAALIGDFLARPDTSAVTRAEQGFGIIRRGRLAWQIGPVVAPHQDQAISLIADLWRPGIATFVDVPQRWTALGGWLSGQGFSIQRSFVRMAQDRAAPSRAPDGLFAIAGPEFG